MGIELDKPLISDKTLELNFTNEGGVEGTFRFLKNITGMWLLQQSKKAWLPKKDYSYEDLVAMAKNEKPFRCFVDSDAHELMNPADMPEAIRLYCKNTGQYVPQKEGEIVRCIFDSLALKYRNVLDQLKQVSPFPIEKLYVIGGGSKNQFLCQLTANATGIPVLAGPAEATALGNIMVQALALDHVKSLSHIREVVRNSVDIESFFPECTSIWENAYMDYLEVINR
jgi:rhamnulokinase